MMVRLKRKHKTHFLAFMCLILGLSLGVSHANNPWDGLGSFDDSEVGTSIFPILKRNPDARGIALGGNLGAMENGPMTMWWNPAGLAEINGYWTNFNHASVYGEFNQDVITTTIPWGKGRTIAFLTNGLWTGDIENGRDINEDSYAYSSTEFMVGAALGYELVPKVFSLGASLYYLNALLDDVNTMGFSADIGLKWNLRWELVNSLSLHNISAGAKSNRAGGGLREKFPMMVRWSIGKPMGPNIVDLHGWNLGLTKSNDGMFSGHVGFEKKIQDMLYVRAGKEYSFNDQEAGYFRGLSGGLGLQVSTLRFDYGTKYHGLLGFEHLLGIKFALFERPARERLPLIDQARAWYAEGDCDKAAILAQALIDKNPNSLEATSILQHCRIQAKVEDKDYIAIIYSGLIKGQLFDHQRGDVLMGGFSRRMKALNNLKERYPINLSIDVGRFAASVRNFERDSLLMGGLNMLNFDAILWNPSVSQQKSYVNGQEVTNPFHPMKLAWIGEDNKIPSSRVINADGRLVFVMGVSDSTFTAIKAQELFKTELKAMKKKHHVDEFALTVFVWNVAARKARNLLESGFDADLVICAQGMPQSESVGKGVLASASIGELGLFRFYFDGSDLLNYDHQMVQLNSGVKPDSQMKKFLQDSIRAPEDVLNKWTPRDESHFLFLHSDELQPEDKPQLFDLYIKDQIKNFDYRVNHHPQQYVSVELSISRGRIAFVESVEKTKVLSIQNTIDKRSQSISPDDIIVEQVRFDPFENWIFYRFTDSKGLHGLNRVRPSGLESTLFLQEEWGKFNDFIFSSDARFMATHWTSSDDSWVEHWSLRSKAHLRVNPQDQYAHTPVYSPNGLYLAYLGESKQEDPMLRGADIILFDVNSGDTLRLTDGARVKSMTWSKDGAYLLYSSGDEIQDLNLIHISTQTSKKLIRQTGFSSEENPQAYSLKDKDGFLYERVFEGERHIYWVSVDGQTNTPLVELKGQNYLPK